MIRGSVIPHSSVTIKQGIGAGGAIGTGRIDLRFRIGLFPALGNAIDPGPCGLNLVATDKGGIIAIQGVKNQAFIGDAAAWRLIAIAVKGIDQRQRQGQRLKLLPSV